MSDDFDLVCSLTNEMLDLTEILRGEKHSFSDVSTTMMAATKTNVELAQPLRSLTVTPPQAAAAAAAKQTETVLSKPVSVHSLQCECTIVGCCTATTTTTTSSNSSSSSSQAVVRRSTLVVVATRANAVGGSIVHTLLPDRDADSFVTDMAFCSKAAAPTAVLAVAVSSGRLYLVQFKVVLGATAVFGSCILDTSHYIRCLAISDDHSCIAVCGQDQHVTVLLLLNSNSNSSGRHLNMKHTVSSVDFVPSDNTLISYTLEHNDHQHSGSFSIGHLLSGEAISTWQHHRAALTSHAWQHSVQPRIVIVSDDRGCFHVLNMNEEYAIKCVASVQDPLIAAISEIMTHPGWLVLTGNNGISTYKFAADAGTGAIVHCYHKGYRTPSLCDGSVVVSVAAATITTGDLLIVSSHDHVVEFFAFM